MRCAEFESRLHELMDDRTAPESDFRLNRHARQCAECRQLLAGATALLDGIDLFHPPSPSSAFARRVASNAAPMVSSSARVSMLTGALVVAASIALVLIPVSRLFNEHASSGITDLRASRDHDLDDGPSSHRPGSVAENSNRLTADDLPGVPETASSRLLPAGLHIPELPRLADVSRQIDSDAIPGVRPITSSFAVAFRLLRGTLPGSRLVES